MKAFNLYIGLLLSFFIHKNNFAQTHYRSENSLHRPLNNNVNNKHQSVISQQNLNIQPVNIGYEMNKTAMGGKSDLTKSINNNLNNLATSGKNSINNDNVTSLPLLNYEASVQNFQTLLSWNTSHTTTNNTFTVERKTSNGVWYKIGSVQYGTTTPTGMQYEFIDATPVNGNNFYRLKQINNGIPAYSNVIQAKLNRGNVQGLLFQNYPNPFVETTVIQYQMRNTGPVKIVVYDLDGKQLAVLVNQNQAQGTYQVEWKRFSRRNVYI
ncbi:MAG: T9SS type A sorting domain-containing protein [Chitinophagaceae bacterium]|nr:T9SS type A sorting domain-containing protein [Chitinophagaceae bacterium]